MQAIPSTVVNKMMPLPDEILSELAVIAKNEPGNVCDISTFLSLSAICKLNNIDDVYAEEDYQNQLIAGGFTNTYEDININDPTISMHYIDVDQVIPSDRIKGTILNIGANVSALPRRNWQNKIILVTGQRITEPYKWFGRVNLEAFIAAQHARDVPLPTADEIRLDVSKLLKEKMEVDTTTLEGVINLNQAATDAQLAAINANTGATIDALEFVDRNITRSRNTANTNATNIINAIGQNSLDTSARIDAFKDALLTQFDKTNPESIYASLDAIRNASVDINTNMTEKLNEIIRLRGEEARVAATNNEAVLKALGAIKSEIKFVDGSIKSLSSTLISINTKSGDQLEVLKDQRDRFKTLAENIRDFNEELKNVNVINKDGIDQALKEIKELASQQKSEELIAAVREVTETIKDINKQPVGERLIADDLKPDPNRQELDNLIGQFLRERDDEGPSDRPIQSVVVDARPRVDDFKFKYSGPGYGKSLKDGALAVFTPDEFDRETYSVVRILNRINDNDIKFEPNFNELKANKKQFKPITEYFPFDHPTTRKIISFNQIPLDLLDDVKKELRKNNIDWEEAEDVEDDDEEDDEDEEEADDEDVTGRGYTSGGAFVKTDFNLTDFEKLKTDLKSQKNIYVFTFN
jgi:hypothetical protein